MLKLNGVLIYNLDQQNCINKILKLGKGPLNPKSGPAPLGPNYLKYDYWYPDEFIHTHIVGFCEKTKA